MILFDEYLKSLISFNGCEINKCQWPKYVQNDVNSINYDKPRVRIADPPEGYTDDAIITPDVIGVLQDENSNRYLMGYYHNITGDEIDITQDKISLRIWI